MATAICQNTDCEKGDWTLRKHPDDYARGVSCPECGTTRVEVEMDGGEQEARAPRRQETTQQSRAPATPGAEGGPDDVFSSLIAVGDSDVDPETRAKGASNLLSVAGNMVQKFTRYQQQKREAKERRAEEATLTKAVDLPECVDCGYTFTGDDIGLNDSRVACPECQAVYDIS